MPCAAAAVKYAWLTERGWKRKKDVRSEKARAKDHLQLTPFLPGEREQA
jgi:hypothetical protein